MGKRLALAPIEPCDIVKGNTTTLYLRFAQREQLLTAFDTLKENGHGDEEVSSAPWSKFNASVTDKYGVSWWLHV